MSAFKGSCGKESFVRSPIRASCELIGDSTARSHNSPPPEESPQHKDKHKTNTDQQSDREVESRLDIVKGLDKPDNHNNQNNDHDQKKMINDIQKNMLPGNRGASNNQGSNGSTIVKTEMEDELGPLNIKKEAPDVMNMGGSGNNSNMNGQMSGGSGFDPTSNLGSGNSNDPNNLTNSQRMRLIGDPADPTDPNNPADPNQKNNQTNPIESIQISHHPTTRTLPWHAEVSSDLRNHLVKKLISSIFPNPSTASIHENAMKKLINLDRKSVV